jgi:glycolate oxidase FAD binding subunit
LITAGRKAFAQLAPVALELISPGLSQDLKLAKSTDCTLLIRFAGSPRSVVVETAQALKLLRDDGNHCETLAEDVEVWSNLSAAPLQAAAELKWRVALRPTDVGVFLNDMAEIEEDGSHPELRWHAGLGDGRLRAIARAPVYHREAVRALERLRQKADSLGGTLVLESAPAEIRDEFDAWGDFGSTAELMQRVKAQLDPRNALSSGRFFREG